MRKVSFRKVDVDGFNIFYREAGPKDAPVLLLLHGFPSASHMFRDLIPQLSNQFRVIAPDLPGFGQSDMPERTKFSYTFDNTTHRNPQIQSAGCQSGPVRLRPVPHRRFAASGSRTRLHAFTHDRPRPSCVRRTSRKCREWIVPALASPDLVLTHAP